MALVNIAQVKLNVPRTAQDLAILGERHRPARGAVFGRGAGEHDKISAWPPDVHRIALQRRALPVCDRSRQFHPPTVG